METQSNSFPPTYKQILEEMGTQIGKRKSLLLERVLLIMWPYLLLVIIGYVLNYVPNILTLIKIHSVLFWTCFGTYLFLAVIYSNVVRFVFQIEKRLWIDSYFDQKNLESSASWRVAKKLFWSGLVFRLHIAWHYYIFPIGLGILALILFSFSSSYFSYSPNGSPNIFAYALIFIPLVFVVGLCIYAYYLKIKLRYAWFIFLDSFGSSYSFQSVVNDINKLNAISKTDTFKKSLVANLGTDTLKGVSQIAIGSLSYGMSLLGNTGKVFGNIFRIYGDEASKQITDLGNITAQYILYRFARKELYGQEQVVNDAVYNM